VDKTLPEHLKNAVLAINIPHGGAKAVLYAASTAFAAVCGDIASATVIATTITIALTYQR
jgi:hypothetical protein